MRKIKVAIKGREKKLEAIAALLKDLKRDLAERGELSEEDKAAIERLLELCEKLDSHAPDEDR